MGGLSKDVYSPLAAPTCPRIAEKLHTTKVDRRHDGCCPEQWQPLVHRPRLLWGIRDWRLCVQGVDQRSIDELRGNDSGQQLAASQVWVYVSAPLTLPCTCYVCMAYEVTASQQEWHGLPRTVCMYVCTRQQITFRTRCWLSARGSCKLSPGSTTQEPERLELRANEGFGQKWNASFWSHDPLSDNAKT